MTCGEKNKNMLDSSVINKADKGAIDVARLESMIGHDVGISDRSLRMRRTKRTIGLSYRKLGRCA